MSAFNIKESQRKASAFFQTRTERPKRRRRSDAGQSRIDDKTADYLKNLLLGMQRPAMRNIRKELSLYCQKHGLPCPTKSTIYKFMRTVSGHRYAIDKLPGAVADTLYNLDLHGHIPGHQLAFYCFNYGGTAAISFAAGLPWLDLYQASVMRGFRPKSYGLLKAVMLVRNV